MNRFGLLLVLVLSRVATATPLPIAEVHKSAKVGETVEIQGTVIGLGGWFAVIQDDTGRICTWDTDRYVFTKTGDVLRVIAKVEMKNGSWHLRNTSIETIGRNPEAAKPIAVTPSEFKYRKNITSCPIALSGVVTDVVQDEFDPGWYVFSIEKDGVQTLAFQIADGTPITVYRRLIDAEITFFGLCCIHASSRPLLESFVTSYFTSNIVIRQPASRDPFLAPELGGFDKRTIENAIRNGHRHRVSGTVLATWNGNAFFLRTDDGQRIRVYLNADADLPSPNDQVTVSGFPRTTPFFAKLTHALVRTEASAIRRTEQPIRTTPRALLVDNQDQPKVKYATDGHLVELAGTLAAIRTLHHGGSTLILENDGVLITVETLIKPTPEIGSTVRITGICRLDEDADEGLNGFCRLKNVTILPRFAEDIVVVNPAPWWTPLRAVIAVSALAALVLLVLIWNFILQKLITRRGRELARESLAHLKAELRVDERTALAVELHDTIAQNLTGVSMQMEGVDEAHRIGSPRLGELIGKTRHALDSCRTELRNCLWDLRNDAFDSDDVSTIIRKAIAPHLGSASADVKLELLRSHISDSTFHALLCIIRELVINAVRHGKATQVDIRGETTATALKITVRDNGCGFDPNDRPGPAEGHFGLLGIQERLDRLGGTLDISSSLGNGAVFTITIK